MFKFKYVCYISTLPQFSFASYAMLLLQDFEMVRIFDSMVFEDEVTDDLSMGLVASGELDATQTLQAMCLVST